MRQVNTNVTIKDANTAQTLVVIPSKSVTAFCTRFGYTIHHYSKEGGNQVVLVKKV